MPQPAAPASESTLPPPAPADRDAPLTYQPLAPAALAGLGTAIVYTLAVVGGAVFGFFTRSPWLMWEWTFLIPVVAIFLCVIARIHIRSSEGVRSGLALTTWGLGLSIVVGSCYGAYYLATRLAVGNQA